MYIICKGPFDKTLVLMPDFDIAFHYLFGIHQNGIAAFGHQDDSLIEFRKFGQAMAARIPIMATTISSSISVKPARILFFPLLFPTGIICCRYHLLYSWWKPPWLPAWNEKILKNQEGERSRFKRRRAGCGGICGWCKGKNRIQCVWVDWCVRTRRWTKRWGARRKIREWAPVHSTFDREGNRGDFPPHQNARWGDTKSSQEKAVSENRRRFAEEWYCERF